MNLNETLFSLISSELSQNENNIDFEKHLSMALFSELYDLSEKHDISSIVASALSKIDGIDDDVSDYINKQLMKSVFRYERMNYDYNLICEIFEKAQIEYLPLKGAVIRNYYPEPWMRTSCDIDILIQKDDSERAIQALCNAGFIRQKDESLYDYSLISPSGVHLELHYFLTTDRIFPDCDNILKFVWDYTTLEEGYSYRHKMINEMLIFYHIAHMSKHFVIGGCGIRPFVDLWLVKNKVQVDNERLLDMLKRAKLFKFYDEVLSLINVWFEDFPHTDVTEQMQNFILTGGVYGTTTNAAKVSAAKGESKIRNFLNLMFLSRANLELVYPVLRKKPGLFLFYQVKRWFRIFNKNKRDKVVHITYARNSVTQDEADLTNNLFKNLDLL